MNPNPRIERRIRLAALLVLAGLVVEAVTLNILHPLSFVFFAMFGVLLIGAGIIVFLLTLLLVAGADEERAA
jgi:hypothetical protein